ncbi:hypothetical protein TNCV_4853101 [Trichonephila clavipes]|nr:hypothetical protein TNCV_4853101 [Trichonephila clavipes]
MLPNAPNSPSRKKTEQEKRNFAKDSRITLSGEVPNQIPIDDKKKIPPWLSQDSNNTSDLTQVLELFQITI